MRSDNRNKEEFGVDRGKRMSLLEKKVKFEKNRVFSLFMVYNNGKSKIIIKKLKELVEKLLQNYEKIIIVEFNDRINKWQIRKDGKAEEKRKSMDNVMNYEAIKFIEFCIEVGSSLRNWATKKKWERA